MSICSRVPILQGSNFPFVPLESDVAVITVLRGPCDMGMGVLLGCQPRHMHLHQSVTWFVSSNCVSLCQDFGFQRLTVVVVSGIHSVGSLLPLIVTFSSNYLSVQGDWCLVD